MLAQPPDFAIYIYSSKAFALFLKKLCKILDKILHKWKVKNMLTIRNVSKTYGRSAGKAVDNLSFKAKTGEIFGFLGPNGAGKTTTIKMITGVIAPDSITH